MSGIDVSIIIVNYNTLDLTRECIDSVFSLTKGLSFEIILVDNASEDGSKEFFEKDSRIIYVYSNENLGFGKANNLGFQRSRGDYIFLLNSDTYLINNAVFLLWEAITNANKDSTSVACVGSLLENKEGRVIHSFSVFPSKRKTFWDNTLFAVLNGFHIKKIDASLEQRITIEDSTLYDVDYITGADLMISRDVITRCGLFDPDFFMYCEESEMQYRYKQAGYRRTILKGPRIVHLVGRSNKSTSPQFRTTYLRSLFLFHKKTSNKMSYYIFLLLFKTVYFFTYIISFPFVNGKCGEKLKHLIMVCGF